MRRENGGVRRLPPVAFFLFGMGERRKLVYRAGVLRDARTGEEVRRWDVGRRFRASHPELGGDASA